MKILIWDQNCFVPLDHLLMKRCLKDISTVPATGSDSVEKLRHTEQHHSSSTSSSSSSQHEKKIVRFNDPVAENLNNSTIDFYNDDGEEDFDKTDYVAVIPLKRDLISSMIEEEENREALDDDKENISIDDGENDDEYDNGDDVDTELDDEFEDDVDKEYSNDENVDQEDCDNEEGENENDADNEDPIDTEETEQVENMQNEGVDGEELAAPQSLLFDY